MKALLLADFYQAKKHCRGLLAIMVLFAAVTVIAQRGENLSLFFAVYAMLLSGIISMTLLAYDEQSKWNIYAQVLPFTRRQQVSAKYLDSLICVAAMWLVFTVVFLTGVGRLGLNTTLVLVCLMPAVGLLPAAIILPVVFRCGVTKGRVVYIIVLIAVAGGGGALGSVSGGELSIPPLPALPDWLLIPLPVVVSAALYALSWALAIRWYEKREL